MKKSKAALSLICVISVLASLLLPVTASAGEATSVYKYTFNLDVYNPCNSNDMDRDAVCDLYFELKYKEKNGFGSSKTYKFDMSWSDGKNRNSDTLWKHFIRPNDNGFETNLDISAPGKLYEVFVKLNMDGGERLGFTVKGIYCDGKRINNNTDYVSSAYYDSTATIKCSMETSFLDKSKSDYFTKHRDFDYTYTQMKNIANEKGDYSSYGFRDQYGSLIDQSVLEKCFENSDGSINQKYSHSDEASWYKYRFCVYVENPININDAGKEEVETFYIDMYYKTENGYGDEKKYTLDMAYDSGLGRNKNPDYLANFIRNNDDGYAITFDVWVPGILTNVKSTLNMSGERLRVNFDKIMLNGVAVNTKRDYVSSVYYDSSAEIPCRVPPAQLKNDRFDQYNSRASRKLIQLAESDPQRYTYHK